MKIVQINTVCGSGSTGKISVEILQHWKKYDNEGIILYGRPCRNVPEESILTQSNSLFYLNALKSRILDDVGFGSRKSTKKIIRIIEEYKPDLVQLHNLHGYYIDLNILFPFLKKYGRPVVWTIHDCWPFTGHCTHYAYYNCEKWKKVCNHCIQKKEYPASFFCDNSSRNFLAKKKLVEDMDNIVLVTPSKWMECQVKQSFLGSKEIHVIYNGIDTSCFTYKGDSWKLNHGLNDKIILLAVADGFGKKKGLYSAIQLSELLDEKYKLVLVGVDNENSKKLPRNILSISKTRDQAELAEIYSAADIFINFSNEESMGLVTIEALACGTPVLVNDATALPEIVTSSGCGMIYKKNDMVDAYRIIKDQGLLTISRSKCRSYALNYAKENKFEQYVALYNKLIKEAKLK